MLHTEEDIITKYFKTSSSQVLGVPLALVRGTVCHSDARFLSSRERVLLRAGTPLRLYLASWLAINSAQRSVKLGKLPHWS